MKQVPLLVGPLSKFKDLSLKIDFRYVVFCTTPSCLEEVQREFFVSRIPYTTISTRVRDIKIRFIERNDKEIGSLQTSSLIVVWDYIYR
jgi:hypothetical protein